MFRFDFRGWPEYPLPPLRWPCVAWGNVLWGRNEGQHILQLGIPMEIFPQRPEKRFSPTLCIYLPWQWVSPLLDDPWVDGVVVHQGTPFPHNLWTVPLHLFWWSTLFFCNHTHIPCCRTHAADVTYRIFPGEGVTTWRSRPGSRTECLGVHLRLQGVHQHYTKTSYPASVQTSLFTQAFLPVDRQALLGSSTDMLIHYWYKLWIWNRFLICVRCKKEQNSTLKKKHVTAMKK